MKLKYLLVLVLSAGIDSLGASECSRFPKRCTRPGQFCRRWDGSTGICRMVYDIKGHGTLWCHCIPRDRSGYPDWGYYWPGTESGSVLKGVADTF